MGFHNSPSIASAYVYTFYEWEYTIDTGFDIISNKDSWLEWLENDGVGDETNSPIIVSYGSTASEAASVRDTASLRGGMYNSDRDTGPVCLASQPPFYWNWVRRNNGSSASCN